MKKLYPLAMIAFAILCTSAYAADPLPAPQQIEVAREQIVTAVAEKKNYCAQPKKATKKGTIVIGWNRDKQGRCTPNNPTFSQRK